MTPECIPRCWFPVRTTRSRRHAGPPPFCMLWLSGTKIRWLLKNVRPPDPGRLAFGTVDTWLIWKLTGGAVHATDFTNAARTLLFDIHVREWDAELASLLEVPLGLLPEGALSFDRVHAITFGCVWTALAPGWSGPAPEPPPSVS